MTRNKRVIGLTGPIAAGKSTVALYLKRRFRVLIIDADKVGHGILETESVKDAIRVAFGEDVFDAKGAVVRSKLAEKAFASAEKTDELERITHPAIIAQIEMLVAESERPIVVVEAIELLQTSLRDLCDETWAVVAPEDVRIRRMMRVRHMSEADAQARIAAQEPTSFYEENADAVVDSGCGRIRMHRAVRALLNKEK